MKLIHTGDIHLGEYPGPVKEGMNMRMADILRCMEYVMEVVNQEKPDAVIIAGDLFNKSRLWSDQALYELRLAARWLASLTGMCPVLLLYGTPNHDNREAFKALQEMDIPGLYIGMEPELTTVPTAAGMLQVAWLPGMERSSLRTRMPQASWEQENTLFSQYMNHLVQVLDQALDQNLPSILIGHYSVEGITYGGEYPAFQQNEIALSPDDLDKTRFDMLLLGHVHTPRRVEKCCKPVYYCGSLNALHFGDEQQKKGFWMHVLGSSTPQSYFFPSPFRRFRTLELTPAQANGLLAQDAADGAMEQAMVQDAIIRVLYRIQGSDRYRLPDRRHMEEYLLEKGAFWIAEIRDIAMDESPKRMEHIEFYSPRHSLDQYLQHKKLDEQERQRVLQAAEPILEAGQVMDIRVLHGELFLPEKLEVRNYRCYTEAGIDLESLRFAMVNGKNGAGKSALFMDAIADCLFERPREGELTGWITREDTVKTGSITFVFRLGEQRWRVIRTRSKNGKASLSLAQEVDGQWQDRSADRMTETQKMIQWMLGMDYNTFQSCVLIMQERYGRFMQADREERMDILSNILGLKAYEEMEKVARSMITEVHRSIRQWREEEQRLEEELKSERILRKEKTEKLQEMKTLETARETLDKTVFQLRYRLRMQEQRIEELLQVTEHITNLRQGMAEREQALQAVQLEKEEWDTLLQDQDEIRKQAALYEKLFEEFKTLQEMQHRWLLLTEQQNQDKEALQAAKLEADKVSSEIEELEYTLRKMDVLELQVKRWHRAKERLHRLEESLGDSCIQELEIQQLEDHLACLQQLHEVESRANEKDIIQARGWAALLDNSGCPHNGQPRCRFILEAENAAQTADTLAEERVLQIKRYSEDMDKLQKEIYQKKRILQSREGMEKKLHKLKDHVEQLLRYKEERDSLTGRKDMLYAWKERQQQLVEVYENKNILLEQQQRELDKVASEVKHAQQLSKKIHELEPSKEFMNRLPMVQTEKKHVEEKIATLQNEILTYRKQLNAWERQELKLKKEMEQREHILSEMETYEAEWKKLQQQIEMLHQRIGALDSLLEQLKQQKQRLGECRRALLEAQKMEERYALIHEAMGQEGIPFEIMKRILPTMELRTNSILGQMTGGKVRISIHTERVMKSNGKEVKTLDLYIEDDYGILPYSSKSGGQKVKAALAVAFALADIKAAQAGLRLGMMFIDEPPFMDAEGVEAYCDALESMHMKYPDMRIIAISHDESMKSRFPQQIYVKAGEKSSTVEVMH